MSPATPGVPTLAELWQAPVEHLHRSEPVPAFEPVCDPGTVVGRLSVGDGGAEASSAVNLEAKMVAAASMVA